MCFFRLGYHVGISIYEISSAHTLSCSDSEREGVRCRARREGVIVTVTEVDWTVEPPAPARDGPAAAAPFSLYPKPWRIGGGVTRSREGGLGGASHRGGDKDSREGEWVGYE